MTRQRDEFLRDILITAVEGGINYWALTQEYDPTIGHAEVVEKEYVGTEDEEVRTLDLDVIRKGLAAAKTKGLGSSSGPEYVEEFWLADRTNGEDGDYDADIADQLVQLGLFDEVIYG